MLKRRAFLTYSLLFLGGCTFAKTTIPESSIPKSAFKGDRPDKLRFAVTDLSGLDNLEQDFGEYS